MSKKQVYMLIGVILLIILSLLYFFWPKKESEITKKQISPTVSTDNLDSFFGEDSWPLVWAGDIDKINGRRLTVTFKLMNDRITKELSLPKDFKIQVTTAKSETEIYGQYLPEREDLKAKYGRPAGNAKEFKAGLDADNQLEEKVRVMEEAKLAPASRAIAGFKTGAKKRKRGSGTPDDRDTN